MWSLRILKEMPVIAFIHVVAPKKAVCLKRRWLLRIRSSGLCPSQPSSLLWLSLLLLVSLSIKGHLQYRCAVHYLSHYPFTSDESTIAALTAWTLWVVKKHFLALQESNLYRLVALNTASRRSSESVCWPPRWHYAVKFSDGYGKLDISLRL